MRRFKINFNGNKFLAVEANVYDYNYNGDVTVKVAQKELQQEIFNNLSNPSEDIRKRADELLNEVYGYIDFDILNTGKGPDIIREIERTVLS